jgi:hypothetical protein
MPSSSALPISVKPLPPPRVKPCDRSPSLTASRKRAISTLVRWM